MIKILQFVNNANKGLFTMKRSSKCTESLFHSEKHRDFYFVY